jgi:hypothetical protein
VALDPQQPGTMPIPGSATDQGVSAVEATNDVLLNQQLSAIKSALSSSYASWVGKLTEIATAITNSLIGGTTGTTANRVLVAKGTTGRALQPTPVTINPSTGDTDFNGADVVDIDSLTAVSGNFTSSLQKNGVEVATVTQAVGASWTFKAPEDETVPVYLNFQFGWTITKVTTITEVGTSTVTVKINTTALGGSSNSASTSESTQNHSSANVVATSDKLQITFASTSSDCENLCVTVQGTRTLQSGP